MLSFRIFFSSLVTLFFFFSCSSSFPVHFFAPFLVYNSSFLSLQRLLLLSFISGTFVDLFRFDFFGQQGLLYLITSFILFRKKQFLFEDRPLYFALFSFLFAFFSEVFRLFSLGIPFFFKNGFYTPFVFSIYTFVYSWFFFVPLLFLGVKVYTLLRRWIFWKKG